MLNYNCADPKLILEDYHSWFKLTGWGRLFYEEDRDDEFTFTATWEHGCWWVS